MVQHQTLHSLVYCRPFSWGSKKNKIETFSSFKNFWWNLMLNISWISAEILDVCDRLSGVCCTASSRLVDIDCIHITQGKNPHLNFLIKMKKKF